MEKKELAPELTSNVSSPPPLPLNPVSAISAPSLVTSSSSSLSASASPDVASSSTSNKRILFTDANGNVLPATSSTSSLIQQQQQMQIGYAPIGSASFHANVRNHPQYFGNPLGVVDEDSAVIVNDNQSLLHNSSASPANYIDNMARMMNINSLQSAVAAGTPPSKNHPAWTKLRNLEELRKEGIISEDDYKDRRQQLIDELTGTKSSLIMSSKSSSSSTLGSTEGGGGKMRSRRGSSRSFSPVVIPRPPPNFSTIQPEHALKIYFDLPTRTWTTKPVIVRFDDTPFARGGLRLVYHILEVQNDPMTRESTLQNLSNPQSNTASNAYDPSASLVSDLGTVTSIATIESSATALAASMNMMTVTSDTPSFCAKMAIDPNEDPSSYFRDVEMQAHCAYYANKFNEYNPPRRVEFCKAWILELIERDGSPLVCVERFIAGPYRKHNNNFGFVSDDERNTPQAFSHFTYEASAHTLLVVDIQGVGDMYTDPQIHTITGRDFGKGNLGRKGFEKFLKTHRCNSICRFLKLPPVNPKYTADGTVPALPYMLPAKIEKEKFEASHIFERTPALQKYLYGHHNGETETDETDGDYDDNNDDKSNSSKMVRRQRKSQAESNSPNGLRKRSNGYGKKNRSTDYYNTQEQGDDDEEAFFWNAADDERCSLRWIRSSLCTIL